MLLEQGYLSSSQEAIHFLQVYQHHAVDLALAALPLDEVQRIAAEIDRNPTITQVMLYWQKTNGYCIAALLNGLNTPRYQKITIIHENLSQPVNFTAAEEQCVQQFIDKQPQLQQLLLQNIILSPALAAKIATLATRKVVHFAEGAYQQYGCFGSNHAQQHGDADQLDAPTPQSHARKALTTFS